MAGFTASAQDRAAQNFSMPALSPTMTEGNIATWKVKEGDSFGAGDVLLEIETDKATMDVEAQDDGMLFKITQGNGAKGVKVGDRIAVFAEEGDDLSSLEMPAEEKSSGQKQEAKKEEAAPKGGKEESVPAPSQSQSQQASRASAEGQGGKAQKQKYPLYPAVQSLLHQNGLSDADAEKIPATGPAGRLLKGDVLAYLGRIAKDYPGQSSARLTKLSHLDLSNIQLAKPAPKPDAPSQQKAAEPELPKETEVAVPVSLSAVIATQKRVQDSLGIFLPLSVFIARASELANEDLPLSKAGKPTAEDLFNFVLGVDPVAKASRGKYTPQVSGVSPAPMLAAAPAKKKDIIDMLAPKAKAPKQKPVSLGSLGVSAGDNVFSVLAQTGEEDRATEYLARMKLALEKEPGRLVL